jgi:hypothetical protein
MVVHGSACVVSFEPTPGTRLAVVWDGGEFADVHVVKNGRCGAVLERWEMVDPWTRWPRISCTPEALAELVRFRMDETGGAGELVAAATAELAGAV